ncbi:mdis1-interacting receptor like kinase 2 [Quercus suber]|uniref:non-specific serine/threonine protein kinase n=1 Tax=Quercus suber TaxID=58331 RepID=A0AAW0M143_QUESU
MHHDCSPPIFHRDISSKNVLLDYEYVAHVSYFGTTRLLNRDSSNWTSFAGTYGYVGTKLQNAHFGQTKQRFARFLKLIREIPIF